MPHPGLTDESRARLSAAIAKKAWDLYELLSRAMAKEDVDLPTIEVPGDGKARPGESKVERLRRYFDAVSAAQRRSRTDEFGICEACGGPIPLVELEERPWRLRCQACGG